MMNYAECLESLKKIEGWEPAASFSVGGFLWLGFSKVQTNKMLCISSQKNTLLDCDSGELAACEADYDEEALFALCDRLTGEELAICGQYGGVLPMFSGKGEAVDVEEGDDHITRVTFISVKGEKTLIYHNYGAYICGFSHDGNYFVMASDGGIDVIKRRDKI